MMDAYCCRTTNNIGEPRAADPTAAAMNRMRRVSTIMVLPFCWDELILPDKGSRQRDNSAHVSFANALSCLVDLLLHECCELLFAVNVQLGVDASGVGSDGVDGHHFAVGDLLGGPPAR